ncbi:hypothetical protein EGW08_006875 [Elysia chlorotica]|uniref:Uncharacterized protein n=1 Tax=Elysia chlorotica TaxID=188477 RepID=A0A433TUU9_ELYCH|nr:hypothetical protein EGW08_006875 [Elysia chlorotica]
MSVLLLLFLPAHSACPHPLVTAPLLPLLLLCIYICSCCCSSSSSSYSLPAPPPFPAAPPPVPPHPPPAAPTNLVHPDLTHFPRYPSLSATALPIVPLLAPGSYVPRRSVFPIPPPAASSLLLMFPFLLLLLFLHINIFILLLFPPFPLHNNIHRCTEKQIYKNRDK